MKGSLLCFEILAAAGRWGELVKFSAMAVNFLEYLEHNTKLPQIKKVVELLAIVAFGSYQWPISHK